MWESDQCVVPFPHTHLYCSVLYLHGSNTPSDSDVNFALKYHAYFKEFKKKRRVCYGD